MSFILDALKKSELERQRQAAPGLVEAGIVRTRPRLPVWAIALIALLAVNLVVLLVLAGRGAFSGSAPPAASRAASNAETPRASGGLPATASEAARTSSETAAEGAGIRPPVNGATHEAAGATREAAGAAGAAARDASGTFSPMDGAAQFAPEIPVVQTPALDPAAAHPVHHREPRPMAHPDEPPEEVLPSISELNISGPELHLDVHVYATLPADRFVYINNRKYREGQTLEEGPTVERIRRDGVVLAYQGVRFLLPRQR
jgi:general secretion pathway protein B